MNRRTTIILVLLFVVLGGYTYWTQFRNPSASANPSATPSATPVAVFNFLTDNATRLQADDLLKNQMVVVVRQDKATWRMLQPKDSATDPNRVDTVLGTLANLQATRVLTDVTDLAPFGLITGTIQARVTLSDTTEYTLKVGNETTDQSSYYALKGGDKQVYLISTSDYQTLDDFVTQPPYPPTPTLTPLPTLTPSLTPTSTPTGTITPATATPPATASPPGTPTPVNTPPPAASPTP